MEYGDAQRFFLQAMMQKGILNTKQVRDLFKFAIHKFDTQIEDGQLGTFVRTIDDKIKPLGMKIKSWSDEDSMRAQNNYVLCCTVQRSTEAFPMLTSRAMHDFDKKDIEFIKLMMNHILTSPTKQLSRQEALNLTREIKTPGKSMSMAEAEKSIEAFVAKKWLKFCPRAENIRLSTRFLAEMENYLNGLRAEAEAEAAEDEEAAEGHPGLGVGRCPYCPRIVVRWVCCETCQAHYHLSCLAKTAEVMGSSGSNGGQVGKCKECKSAINLQGYAKASRSSQSQRAPAPTQRKRTRMLADSDDSE